MLMSGEAFKDKYGEEKYNDSFDRVMNSDRNGFSDLADAYNDGMDIYLIDAFGRTNVVSSFGSLGETITSENGGISFSNSTAGAHLFWIPQGGGSSFNINNAVNTLNENANERSVHACGRYVGLALQAGGIKGAMADGKDYGPILLKNGFNVVSKTGYSPFKGDITVYDGNATHKWGHVQMYNGNQWVSDFFQGYIGIKTGYEYGGNGFMVYSKDIPALTIYRIGN
jgi:hypothetical protein